MSLRDNQLFEITEVEIARVDCMSKNLRITSPTGMGSHFDSEQLI